MTSWRTFGHAEIPTPLNHMAWVAKQRYPSWIHVSDTLRGFLHLNPYVGFLDFYTPITIKKHRYTFTEYVYIYIIYHIIKSIFIACRCLLLRKVMFAEVGLLLEKAIGDRSSLCLLNTKKRDTISRHST